MEKKVNAHEPRPSTSAICRNANSSTGIVHSVEEHPEISERLEQSDIVKFGSANNFKGVPEPGDYYPRPLMVTTGTQTTNDFLLYRAIESTEGIKELQEENSVLKEEYRMLKEKERKLKEEHRTLKEENSLLKEKHRMLQEENRKLKEDLILLKEIHEIMLEEESIKIIEENMMTAGENIMIEEILKGEEMNKENNDFNKK